MADRFDSSQRRGRGSRGGNGSYSRGDSSRGPRRFESSDRRNGRDGFSGGNREDRYDRRDGQRSDRRFDRNERGDQRGGRRFERSDRDFRSSEYGDRRQGGERSGRFDRDSRDSRGFSRDRRDAQRSDRRFDRNEGGDQRGGRRFERSDRDFRSSEYGDRRQGGERSGRFDRDSRDSSAFSRDRRDGQRSDRRFDRNERGDQRGGRNFRDTQRSSAPRSRDEYTAPNGDEPTIPAGVSAEELDKDALRALSTLSGINRDIVARHLVMAGQLIDLDPELAYKHAKAAASRAGRVDVVREASALTAYAAGHYEEALREVRAMRRLRGDLSLRAIEADCERGLGRPERAIEIIDQTDTSQLDLAEQVELVLVSSGARADLGENEVGLVIVDDAIATLGSDADPGFLRRLMSVKADRLRELGREEEAAQVEAEIPEEEEDPDIVDVGLFADADVDDRRSPLKGSKGALYTNFDAALLDLDGTAYAGKLPIEHAAQAAEEAREAGLKIGFVTNNASRTPAMIAAQLDELGFKAQPSDIMTSAMDVIAVMSEHLDEGASVYVVGGEGLRQALREAGYVLVESADDQPAAVVQGFDASVTWAQLTEAAFALERGAQFFATNLDATLPQERGFALGNGALVRAVSYATRKRPIAAGKPEPGIYQRGAELIDSQNPIAVGDRLETDILGAVAAGIPALHVLTGVHDARAVICAPRGQRPSYLALDMRGLLEEHPSPKHHADGTWTCGISQVARLRRDGHLTLDDVELREGAVISMDSYRALAAAAWDSPSEIEIVCPTLTVVPNDDPSGYFEALDEPVEESEEGVIPEENVSGVAETLEFLPGEEDLQELLAQTSDLDGEDD